MGLLSLLALQCVGLTEELLWYVTLSRSLTITVAVYQHLKCKAEGKKSGTMEVRA